MIPNRTNFIPSPEALKVYSALCTSTSVDVISRTQWCQIDALSQAVTPWKINVHVLSDIDANNGRYKRVVCISGAMIYILPLNLIITVYLAKARFIQRTVNQLSGCTDLIYFSSRLYLQIYQGDCEPTVGLLIGMLFLWLFASSFYDYQWGTAIPITIFPVSRK